jgi:hypothetical protein
MEWTPEVDARLRELHAKRVSLAFIASWMQLPRSEVRARLVALGLAKPISPRIVIQAPKLPEGRTAEPINLVAEEADEDADMVELPGRPLGHLVSEAAIAALYRRAGGSYR